MLSAAIYGLAGSHESTMKDIFMAESGSAHWCTLVNSMGSSIESLISRNYHLIMYAQTDAYSYEADWKSAIDVGQGVICAHGSNSHINIGNSMGYAIYVGGGTSSNIRSYGPGLEYYAENYMGGTEESYVVPTIGALYLQIKSLYPFYDHYQIRQYLRQLANLYPNRTDTNGFGKVASYRSLSQLDTFQLLGYISHAVSTTISTSGKNYYYFGSNRNRKIREVLQANTGSGSATASLTSKYVVQNNSAYAFSIMAIARSSENNSIYGEYKGMMKNKDALSMVGQPSFTTIVSDDSVSSATLSAIAHESTSSIQILLTGSISSLSWTISIDSVQV